MDTKTIIITLKPVVLNVREDMTDEEITAMLDRNYTTLDADWREWKYEEPWRN